MNFPYGDAERKNLLWRYGGDLNCLVARREKITDELITVKKKIKKVIKAIKKLHEEGEKK